jgi:Flp pilus assembly protein TadD
LIKRRFTLGRCAALAIAVGISSTALSLLLSFSEDQYDAGRSALFAGDNDEALIYFGRSARNNWRQPMFYFGHALAATRIATGATMPSEPWKPLPSISAANISLIEDAIRDCRMAIGLSRDDPAFWSTFAWNEAFLGKDSEALSGFRQAVILDPGDAASHISLGLWYERNDLIDQAFDQYQQAVLDAPSVVDSQFYLDLASRYPDRAKVIISNAIGVLSKNTQDPTAEAALAKLHAFQGHDELARQEFLIALDALPNLSYTWTNLGATEIKLSNREAARLDFERALSLNIGNAIATNNLASLALSEGDNRKAILLYTQVMLNPPVSAHAQRTWRIYHISAIDTDDMIPNGLLRYISPPVEPIRICGQWLTDLSQQASMPEDVKDRIYDQQLFCLQHP